MPVPVRGGRRPRLAALLAVLVAAGLFRATQNVAQTTDPLLAHQLLHLSPSVIGAIVAGSLAVSVLVNVTVATRVPVHRLRSAVVAGAALLAASLVLFALARSVSVFIAAALLLGAAGGLALPSLASAAGGGLSGARRDRALAFYTLALSTSLGLGPLLESAILTGTGNALRAPFEFFPVLAVLAVLVVLVAPRAKPADSSATVGRSRQSISFRELLAVPGWRLAVTVDLLYALPFVTVTTFGALLARQDYGATPAQAALMFTAFFTASLLARACLAVLPMARFTPALIAGAVVTTLAGLLLLALGRGLSELVLAAIVLGVPHGVTFPVVLGLVARSVPPEQLPAANALLLAVANGSTVLAPSILGVLAAHAGYRATMLIVVIPAAGFGAVLARALGRHRLPT